MRRGNRARSRRSRALIAADAAVTSAQIAAFKAAVGGTGYTPGSFAVLFALIAAAALLTWAAFMVARLSEDYLDGRIKERQLFAYKVRMLVLVLIVVYLLN